MARWLRGAATLTHGPAAQAGATAGLGLALAGGAVALHVAHAGHRPVPTISAVSASAHRFPRRAADLTPRLARPAASAKVSTRHPTPGVAAPSTTQGYTVPSAMLMPGDAEPSAAKQSAQPSSPSTSTVPAVPVPAPTLPVPALPLPAPALPALTVTAPAVPASTPTIDVPGATTLTAPTSTTPTVTIR